MRGVEMKLEDIAKAQEAVKGLSDTVLSINFDGFNKSLRFHMYDTETIERIAKEMGTKVNMEIRKDPSGKAVGELHATSKGIDAFVLLLGDLKQWQEKVRKEGGSICNSTN